MVDRILKVEFRRLVSELPELSHVSDKVLASLDQIEASGEEARGDDVEWRNVCDVHGRRIHRTLAPLLD